MYHLLLNLDLGLTRQNLQLLARGCLCLRPLPTEEGEDQKRIDIDLGRKLSELTHPLSLVLVV